MADVRYLSTPGEHIDVTTTRDVRVLVVDDDPFVRSALRMVLDDASDIVVVGEAADGAAALAELGRHQVDVVLSDLAMPGTSGLDLLRTLADDAHAPPVVVLTNHIRDADIVAALAAGALGYVDKSGDPALAVEAIRRAASGDSVLSATVTRSLVEPLRRAVPSPQASTDWVSGLTDREQEIAAAVARGLSNEQIAELLRLSLSTVKTNVSRILSKTQLSNRVQISMLVHGIAFDAPQTSRVAGPV